MLISPAVSSLSLQIYASNNGRQLVSATDNLPIPAHGIPEASRKRKRGQGAPDNVEKQSFTITPRHSSSYHKPQTFRTICLIQRAHLPLSMLDLSAAVPGCPPNSLFSARIQQLEEPSDGNMQVESAPMVLIAQNEANRCLYAIERVDVHTYALCKLVDWIDIDMLQQYSTSGDTSIWRYKATSQGESAWWGKARLQRKRQTPNLNCRPGKAERPQLSMDRPAPISLREASNAPVSDKVETVLPSTDAAPGDNVESTSEAPLPHLSAQECYNLITTQYLDTLYLSKMSLAYFAKGPLSRARAAFSADHNPSGKTDELVAFVRSLLLSSATLDKKHLKRIPKIIKNTLATKLGDATQEDIMKKPPKKRKSTSLRPGKDGLYPHEHGHVSRWWLADDAEADTAAGQDMPREDLEKKRSGLRLRETLMQIILSLEVIALEKSCSLVPEGGQAQDTRRIERNTGKNDGSDEEAKHNGQQTLNNYIDVLIDKLCIWQSVEEDVRSMKGSKVGKADGLPDDTVAADGNISLKLRSFCVEVVMPFYKSRLSDIAAAICKKLGSPTVSSPLNSSSSSSAGRIKRAALPGCAVHRGEHQKARRSLQRVATEVSQQASFRPPSLARAATDSCVSGLKTEPSDIPLATIPLPVYQRPLSGRGGLPQSRKSVQREVDLRAVSTTHESKLKTKVAVEEELRNAISMLKKPNRGLAVKDYVDSAEQRTEAIGHWSRKSTNPVRNRLLNSVLVDATPKRTVKSKDVGLPTPPRYSSVIHLSDDCVPQSSNPCIPSSTVRPQASKLVSNGQEWVPASTIRRPRASHNCSVEETPSRGSAKTVSYLHNMSDKTPGCNASRAHLPTSQVAGLKSIDSPSKALRPKPQTPARAIPAARQTLARSQSELQQKAPEMYGTSATAGSTSASQDAEEAADGILLYESLGWNDGVDELM